MLHALAWNVMMVVKYEMVLVTPLKAVCSSKYVRTYICTSVGVAWFRIHKLCRISLILLWLCFCRDWKDGMRNIFHARYLVIFLSYEDIQSTFMRWLLVEQCFHHSHLAVHAILCWGESERESEHMTSFHFPSTWNSNFSQSRVNGSNNTAAAVRYSKTYPS